MQSMNFSKVQAGKDVSQEVKPEAAYTTMDLRTQNMNEDSEEVVSLNIKNANERREGKNITAVDRTSKEKQSLVDQGS